MDWLSLLLIILIAVITYIQTLYGFISALIMLVLVLVTVPFAFTVYEFLAFRVVIDYLNDLALPVSFMVSFIAPLIGLRLLMDKYITRANLLPVLFDKIGAAVAGFFAAWLLAGVIAVAVFMIPFSGSFLGKPLLDRETGEPAGLWLSPHRVAVGYAVMMSNGVFSGPREWSNDHPDLIQELAWAMSTHHNSRQIVPPGSVELIKAEIRQYIFNKTEGPRHRGQRPEPTYSPVTAEHEHYWLLLRLQIHSTAEDSDTGQRFSSRQIRLVGFDNPNADASNYYVKAINDNDDPSRAVTIEPDEFYRPDAAGEVDVVFEVPDKFVPRFVEYKLGSRIDLTQVSPASAPEPPPAAASRPEPPDTRRTASAPPAPEPTTPPEDRRSGGRVSGVRGSGEEARFSDELPMPMTDYQQFDFDHTGEAMARGHIYGERDEQAGSGPGPRVTEFQVPPDKRMFQLDVRTLQAGSTLGRALSFAVTSVRNYQLRDAAGNAYPVVGQFAVADVDGTEVVEVQYFPEAVGATGRGGIRDFSRIKDRHLEGSDYRLVYLFLVEPGAQLTEFTTGTGRRPTDLRDRNLVAPN